MSALNKKQWQLTAISEALGDLTLTVDDTLSVGRGKDNDVVLGSKQISRQHAVLSILNGELFVKDLGSSNGTSVNNKQLEPNKSKHLNEGDTVNFSVFEFRVAQAAKQNDESSMAGTVKDSSAAENEPMTNDDASMNAPVNASTNDDASLNDSVSSDNETTDYNSKVVIGSKLPEEDNTMNNEKSESVVKEQTVKEQTIEEPTLEEKVSLEDKVDGDKDSVVTQSIQTTEGVTDDHPRETEKVGTITDEKLEAELEEPIPIGDPNQDIHHPETQPTDKPEGEVHTRHDDETSAEHFKELAEEADPEVLKAKQAAAAKFSGTVGVNHDEPTSQQPSMTGDKVTNSTIADNTDHPVTEAGSTQVDSTQPTSEKQSSMIIWVIVAIILIILAIWLFTQG